MRIAARPTSPRPVRTWGQVAVYYGGAIFCGSLFVALSYFVPYAASWASDGRLFSGFLLACGMSLAGGAPAVMVVAWLLRAVTSGLRITSLPGWLAAGIVAGLAVPWLFAELGYRIDAAYFPAEWQGVKLAVVFPFMGPMMYVAQPVQMRSAVALATALVLFALARRTGG